MIGVTMTAARPTTATILFTDLVQRLPHQRVREVVIRPGSCGAFRDELRGERLVQRIEELVFTQLVA